MSDSMEVAMAAPLAHFRPRAESSWSTARPPLERAAERGELREAEPKGDLGKRRLGSADELARQALAYGVDELGVARAFGFEPALQRARAHVQADREAPQVEPARVELRPHLLLDGRREAARGARRQRRLGQ